MAHDCCKEITTGFDLPWIRNREEEKDQIAVGSPYCKKGSLVTLNRCLKKLREKRIAGLEELSPEQLLGFLHLVKDPEFHRPPVCVEAQAGFSDRGQRAPGSPS